YGWYAGYRVFFFSSRRRHTRFSRDWSSDVCSSDLRKVLRELSLPFLVDGREMYVTGSIGIARFPGDGTDVHTLLRKADSAMYRRSEERRVGQEGRSRRATHEYSGSRLGTVATHVAH